MGFYKVIIFPMKSIDGLQLPTGGMVTRKRRRDEMMEGVPFESLPTVCTKKRLANTPLKMIEFLGQLMQKSRGVPSKQRKRRDRPARRYCSEFKKLKGTKYLLRHEHSEAVQSLVIFLRFGSLKHDQQAWLRPHEVERRTGIRACSQLKIIRRWRMRGYLVMKTPKDGRKEILQPEQIKWLVDYNTLEDMSHLGLRQRAMMVKERFQLPSFSHVTLRQYYRRYGVKFNKPNYKYWRSQAENNDLRGQQLEHVRMMVRHME